MKGISEMPKLSIIVPIYNVEPYLARCIDSILAQTFADFELILIDDGSPDNCAAIMEKYAKRDKRIVTIHQENKGVSAARNAGLDVARGTYIGFVDPDDWIEPDMYESMLQKLGDTDSDLAVCAWRACHIDGRKEENCARVPEIMSREAFVSELFAIPRSVGGSCWNKLFKRELISRAFDATLTICEDNLFLCRYCMSIHRACYTGKISYNVFISQDSATRSQPQKVVLGLPVRREMIQIVSPLGKSLRDCAEADYLDSCMLYVGNWREQPKSGYEEMSRKEFAQYIRTNHKRVLSNPSIPFRTKLLYFCSARLM